MPTSEASRYLVLGIAMNTSVFRSIRARGLLAVIAAVILRALPDGAQCVALPGASIYMLPNPRVSPAPRVGTLALQGRAAPTDVAKALRTHDS
jgi:hypothetical protein